jgi:hypothetical protein
MDRTRPQKLYSPLAIEPTTLTALLAGCCSSPPPKRVILAGRIDKRMGAGDSGRGGERGGSAGCWTVSHHRAENPAEAWTKVGLTGPRLQSAGLMKPPPLPLATLDLHAGGPAANGRDVPFVTSRPSMPPGTCRRRPSQAPIRHPAVRVRQCGKKQSHASGVPVDGGRQSEGTRIRGYAGTRWPTSTGIAVPTFSVEQWACEADGSRGATRPSNPELCLVTGCPCPTTCLRR